MAVPTRSDPQFKLRIPETLKDRIEVAADKNSRSMTAEIIAALEEKYPPEDDFDRWLDLLDRAQKLKHSTSKERSTADLDAIIERAKGEIAEALSSKKKPRS